MMYIDLMLAPTERIIHPIDGVIAAHDGIHCESLLHVDVRSDNTTVLLYKLTGDKEVLEARLREHEGVHSQETIDDNTDTFYAFVQTATECGGKLEELARRHTLIIQTPLEYVDDGVRATLVGTHENLRQALGAIPNDIDFSVENAGSYVPDDRDPLSSLTDRQLEVFQTAVEEGYYDVSRRVTQKDIADVLGCSSSTVDEHLRKAESRVVSKLMHQPQ